MRKRDVRLLLMALAVGVASPASADAVFDDEKEFLSTAGSASFESFEEPTAHDSARNSSIRMPAFTVTTRSRDIGIFSYAIVGLHPTDGEKHLVWDSDPGEIVFTFDAPISAFGVSLTDALDQGGNSNLSLTTNGGANFPAFLVGPLGDANERFVGIITETPFTRLTILNNTRDSMGFDAIHFRPISEPTAKPAAEQASGPAPALP